MKDKKVMISTIIAVSTLLVLIVGATFAYFSASNSASGNTLVTTKTETIGSVIVTNPTEKLHLKLSANDMQEANKGTSYYATEDSEASHSNGKENNVIAKYTISGGEQSTVYNCSFNMSVNKPSEIQEGDMTLKFTGIGAKINGLSNVSVDLSSADDNYQVTFSRVGNGIGNLVVGDITFNNTDVEQNYLEDTTINASVTLSGMTCSIETTEEPDLFDGTLTPVVYDGDNWKIVSADDKDWYDYENQEWANAVILESSSTKTVGDTVSVEGSDPDVLAMYVWIPRYEYRIQGEYGLGGTGASSPGEIEVNFISKDTTVASDGYMVHPAFTLGGEELSGIWVGKFEISHETLSSSTTANSLNCSNESCANANEIRILPNKISLRRNNISNFFYGIKSMEQDENVFGINKETTDSHMIKNSEWGAVAYLSQSTYGKYGNDDYEGTDKEIYINNSKSYYTGRSGGSGSVSEDTNGTYEYNNEKLGTGASTTGNITGIYDMSGGSFDCVMAVLSNSTGALWSGNSTSANSGFIGYIGTTGSTYSGINWPSQKYYDVYKETSEGKISALKACNNGVCYGHALTETDVFYSASATFVSEISPFNNRGGYYGSGSAASIFAYGSSYGSASQYTSTRAVLTSKSSLTKEYKTYENGEVVYFDVETGLKCTNYNEENSKTGYNGIDNRTGNQNSCLKFYAFNDNGGSKLNLLLDHNTTATSLWNSSGDVTNGPTDTLEQLKQDTKDWKGTIEPDYYETGSEGKEYSIDYKDSNARLITSNELAKIVGFIGWNERKTLVDITFYFDSRSDNIYWYCQEGDITECNYGWLYDRTATDCENEGCYNNSDVDMSGYWTASSCAIKSNHETHQICDGYTVYGVSHHARQGRTCSNYEGHYGVRPVIEVSKEDLIYTSAGKICRLADDSTVAEGEYGAKYNCKVDPNKDAYTFYLIDNNDDGTSDLIMNANINASGEAVIPGVTSDTGMVAWYEGGTNNINGPVTAMTYLYNATKSWSNVESVNYTYKDREVQGITDTNVGYESFISTNGIATITKGDTDGTQVIIGNETEPLRARMPIYSSDANITEVTGKTKASYLYDNLDSGYWTLTSYVGGDSAWIADYIGDVVPSIVDGFTIDSAYSGVRPVITVKLK